MKEMLNSVSVKIKYFFTALVSIFFAANVLYIGVFFFGSSFYSDKFFKFLAFSEVLLIFFIGYNMYKLTKKQSILQSIAGVTENEISESSLIFDTISDGIIVVDNKGRVRTINQGLCKLLDIEESQVINKNLYDILSYWETNDENKALPRIIIETLETHIEFRHQEKVFFKNNETLHLAISTYILKNKYKSIIGVLAVINDFTQIRKFEQQIMQAEKLATAGQMAAELAHEIKNPICSIKGLIQVLGKKHSLQDSKYYEVITEEIERISSLLHSFLSLTQSKPVFAKISMNEIIEDILPVLESQALCKNIHINFDMQRELPRINADRENVRQVIVNIVQNAIDALQNDGKINISVWYDEISERIKMEFKDNGAGIKPEILDKIFEPFFTTKENGSGLGLAISHRIIENHEGKLFAFNNLEGGATFVIELPASKCNELIQHKVS